MTKKDLAKTLGISQPYFSLIYNGKAKVSQRLADDWKDRTGRTFKWFQTAPLAKVQHIFNKLLNA